ncbi:MAG: PAC2 family protein [Sulfolobales archaeon]|nr:PAC2 family protein [Sulfolobales archaeon]MCX8198953.1 PAC2 family protein [Sulfolobales archaeon]MDW8169931.1 PAC2 family protein [Desulfurococcaceae archaeon]
MSRINIILNKVNKEELHSSTFITGFPGFGLVGYLASKHLAYALNLKRAGFIETLYVPESTFYINNVGIVYPFELYYGSINDVKLLVLVNHTVPEVRERAKFARAIAQWVKELRVSETFLLGGLDPSIRESSGEVYRWIPFGGTRRKMNAPILEERYVVGPLALLMMYLDIFEVPGVTILSYAEPYRPDPRASATAITALSDALDVSVDVSQLSREAEIIEEIEKSIQKSLESGSKPPYPMYM